MIIYTVCVPAEDCWESRGVFSSYEKARAYVTKEGFKSWAIDSHTLDVEE